MRQVDLDGEVDRDRHIGGHAATVALLAVALAFAITITGCHYDTGQADGAFYDWDGRKVHCAIDIDTFARNDVASVEAGLDRAVERGEVLELYAHDPGRTVEWSAVEQVLAAAQTRGLTFFTYPEIARGDATPGPGVLLSFDDASVGHWVDGIPLFAEYQAHVTFFVAYYPTLSAAERDGLHQLAAAGHAIEPHSITHVRAPLYVEHKGVGAYMADEALPSMDLLKADGFDDSIYAYPYGSRTSELDDALLRRAALLRSVTFTWSGPADPCPR